MAATLDELLAQYKAQEAYAQTQANEAKGNLNTGLAIGSGALGLVGAVAAPFATEAIGNAFGLNRRSAAEEEALKNIRDVATGATRTAAQTALEYQRGRTARMATQAAAMGPARERAARQLVGQEQNIGLQQDITGQAATIKAQEQAQAQRALADIETRAGEAERQRRRQMVAGSISGGLGALSQAYGGYVADKLRQSDLAAKAAGAGAAVNSIMEQRMAQQYPGAAPGARPTMRMEGTTQDRKAPEPPASGFRMTPAQFQLPIEGAPKATLTPIEQSMTRLESPTIVQNAKGGGYRPGAFMEPTASGIAEGLELSPTVGTLDAALGMGPFARRAKAKKGVR